MRRGRVARVDYEYERNGTANLFIVEMAERSDVNAGASRIGESVSFGVDPDRC
jgi:hypothetical protein